MGHFQWQFEGILAGKWILVSMVLVGIIWSFYWYRKTLKPLPVHARIGLVILRVAFWCLLLLFLANPVRMDRGIQEPPHHRPLAVLVDRSESMTTPDARHQTRLDDAMTGWNRIRRDAEKAFGECRFFHFTSSPSPDPNAEEAARAGTPGKETRLYQSVISLLKSAPPGGYGGVVCLTDGLDTSSDNASDLVNTALIHSTPIYFIPGKNQLRSAELMAVCETRVPGRVLHATNFDWHSLVEICSTRARTVHVSLSCDGNLISQADLKAREGLSMIPWSAKVIAGDPGTMRLEMTVGEGASSEKVSASVHVLDKEPVSLLYYQGTLDWGFRFLSSALRRDPSFSVTALFNPSLHMRLISGSGDPHGWVDLPVDAAALRPFQLVVLAQTYADQLSDDQQKALVEYVREGGALLFMTADTKASMAFAGSKLEEMFPVVFETASAVNQREVAAQIFQDAIAANNNGNSPPGSEDLFASQSLQETDHAPLTPFALPDTPQPSPLMLLFDPSKETLESNPPLFASYAQVKGPKPGAEVIAIHPTDKESDSNQNRVLLATQSFGRGHASILTTDSLWRWKLSLPSESKKTEVFWQQFFFFLTSGSRTYLHFTLQSLSASLNKTCHLSLEGGYETDLPVLQATGPAGETMALAPKSDPEKGTWEVDFTPKTKGSWQITANDSRNEPATVWLRVRDDQRNNENSGLPPDLPSMRQIAEATGGELIVSNAPLSWNSAATQEEPQTPVHEVRRLLWNNPIFLLLCIACYSAELIWRRKYRLI